MPVAEKKFVLTHVVKDVMNLKEEANRYSPSEEHFCVTWKMRFVRRDKHLSLYIRCKNETDSESSILANYTLKLLAVNGKAKMLNGEKIFKTTAETHFQTWGWTDFIDWEEMKKDYMIDGNIVIEAHVKILKMTGIEKKKLRNFDESMKEFSDVVLVAGEEKFYVSKLFLSCQSTHFKTLFLRKFEESEKSEITLKNVNPKDFQNFLELLYGDSPIDEDTVEGIVNLADMYDV